MLDYIDWLRLTKPALGTNKRTKSILKSTVRVALYTRVLSALRNDFADANIEHQLLSRLRASDQVLPVLFELQVAAHYKFEGLDSHWIPNSGHSEQDVIVRTQSGEHIYIECRFLAPKSFRMDKEKAFIGDIMEALREKAKQHAAFVQPLIVAIGVPEEYYWQDRELIQELYEKVKRRFTSLSPQNAADYAAISEVLIPTASAIEHDKVIKTGGYEHVFHDGLMNVMSIRNQATRSPLPSSWDASYS